MTTLADRLLDKEFVRTNPDGAENLFPVGAVVRNERENRMYRVTRHKVVPTSPWATIIVYGVKA